MSYLCKCSRCQGKKYFSYSTIRRHASLYGRLDDSSDNLQKSDDDWELDEVVAADEGKLF